MLLTKQAVSNTIDYALSKFKNLYFPNHAYFSTLQKTFNQFIKRPTPIAIAEVQHLNEVSDLLLESTFEDVPILMRSGGHSYAGFSTGRGLVLDTRKLKNIQYNSNSITLGAGLTLKEAQDKLAPNGFTFPSGEFPDVGIAGYFLGGGHSRRSRYLGMGADAVKSMSVHLASGEKLQHVSPTQRSDLYWALLGGGGGNFAYVDSFEIEKIRSFKEYFFKYTFPASVVNEKNDVFEFWEEAIKKSPDHIAVNITVYIHNGYISKLIVSGLIMNIQGDLSDAETQFRNSIWSELGNFDPSEFEGQMSNPNFIRSTRLKEMTFKGASHYAAEEIGVSGFEQMKEAIKRHSKQSNMYMGLYSMGGKINRPQREISFPHRNSLYMIDLFSNFREDTSKHELFRNNFNSLYRSLEGLFSGRSYINYPDPDFGVDWPKRYYGDSLEKLIEIKKVYDPKNRFDYGVHSLSRLV